MTFEDYERRIIEIASKSLASQHSVQDVLAVQSDRIELAAFRFPLITDSERNSWGDLLSMGICAGEPEDVRLGLILVTIDSGREANRIDFRSRCGSYEDSALVARIPTLREFVRNDLIAAEAITQVENTDVVRVQGGYGRLDGMLNPLIAEWALGCFPRTSISVRLDPREGGPDLLQARLNEYVLRPPNPTWWRTLGLRRGTTDSGCFILDPSSTPEPARHAAIWEHSVEGIRSLEFFVKRENQGRFSMMVEEISDRHALDGIMIGRCIHLDSHSPEGTPFENALLEHIDLAVNVYEDADRKSRAEQGLHEGGKVVNASCRTHLLRIDGAPFTTLFDLAIGFFQSTTMLREWFKASFPPEGA